MWNVRMFLVGSLLVWLSVVVVLSFEVASHWVLRGIEVAGVPVIVVSSVLFYLVNEEMVRWRESEERVV